MFNFVNLIQTSIITMGVATATPIHNEAVTSDYTLNLSETYISYISAQYQQVNDDNVSGTVNDIRYNITGGNSYLNVIGNQYKTKVYYEQGNETSYFIKNANKVHLLTKSYPCEQIVIVLKITPYNYNENTELNLAINVEYTSEEDIFINDYDSIDYGYMFRGVYATTQENWDIYVDRQLTKNASATIINDITDVNNNYYYTYNENIKQLADTEDIDNSYTDNITLDIVPKTDNYVVIQYAPLATAYRTVNGVSQLDTRQNIKLDVGTFDVSNYNITGTNIIPSSNYEVVDLPGLMWQILTMPFAFVSQAFNLTLFPGTPYQLNISNLFLAIIAVIAFIWLITFILKMKG